MKRNSCGCGSPNMVGGAHANAHYGNVSPANISPANVSPANISPSAVSPAASGPLPAIVAPEKTVVKNFYHTAKQPVIHPINIINQHHTIPVPEHFCTYNVKDVHCGLRNRRGGRR